MPKAEILILGAGVGGLVASNVLKKDLKDKANVTVIDRKTSFQFPPSYPWLMLGERKPEQVQKDLAILKKKKGINVVNDEVVSIDPEKRMVTTSHDSLRYEYLIIALGAEFAPSAVPGFEHANHIYDLDSAVSFAKKIKDFEGGTIAIGIARTPFKCPAAPYEVALLLEDYYSNKGMKDRVRFEFFTPESMPLPAAGPEIGTKVVDLFRARGITFHPKLKLAEITEKGLSFGSGERIQFDLLFCVPPHTAPKPIVEVGLTNETGWIPVNPRTLETSKNGVYAVGDITALPTPHGYVPYLPKAGVFAHGQAEVVANNIAALISGKGRRREWDGHGACFLEVGHGQSAFLDGNFLAEPKPELKFHSPGKRWHAEKVLFEKYWMHHWF